jgi:hypothetical protein
LKGSDPEYSKRFFILNLECIQKWAKDFETDPSEDHLGEKSVFVKNYERLKRHGVLFPTKITYANTLDQLGSSIQQQQNTVPNMTTHSLTVSNQPSITNVSAQGQRQPHSISSTSQQGSSSTADIRACLSKIAQMRKANFEYIIENNPDVLMDTMEERLLAHVKLFIQMKPILETLDTSTQRNKALEAEIERERKWCMEVKSLWTDVTSEDDPLKECEGFAHAASQLWNSMGFDNMPTIEENAEAEALESGAEEPGRIVPYQFDPTPSQRSQGYQDKPVVSRGETPREGSIQANEFGKRTEVRKPSRKENTEALPLPTDVVKPNAGFGFSEFEFKPKEQAVAAETDFFGNPISSNTQTSTVPIPRKIKPGRDQDFNNFFKPGPEQTQKPGFGDTNNFFGAQEPLAEPFVFEPNKPEGNSHQESQPHHRADFNFDDFPEASRSQAGISREEHDLNRSRNAPSVGQRSRRSARENSHRGQAPIVHTAHHHPPAQNPIVTVQPNISSGTPKQNLKNFFEQTKQDQKEASRNLSQLSERISQQDNVQTSIKQQPEMFIPKQPQTTLPRSKLI